MSLVGYRKFSIVAGVIVIGTGLLVWHRLTGAEYVQLIMWVSGLYFGANSLQKVGVAVADTKKAEAVTALAAMRLTKENQS